MSEYETIIAAAFKVLPVKSVLTTWTRRGKIHCDKCKMRKQETVKHLFCRCMYPLYEAIHTKRHDKMVCELYCWINVQAKNNKLGRFDSFQIWMAENTWSVPEGNILIFPDI